LWELIITTNIYELITFWAKLKKTDKGAGYDRKFESMSDRWCYPADDFTVVEASCDCEWSV